MAGRPQRFTQVIRTELQLIIMNNPEFTIQQIREFVAKGFGSVAARYVKSALEHYDNVTVDGVVADESAAPENYAVPDGTTWADVPDSLEMPFGKHKGKKVCNVPASYLLWLLDQDWFKSGPLKTYILENKETLELEVTT